MRVLKWMLDRVDGTAGGEQTLFGTSPRYDDISWTGLDFTRAQYQTVTTVDHAAWQQELKLHDELMDQLSTRLPAQLRTLKAELEARLAS
jgi:phosphoenolpyruvate carboxykinase (GTP)